MLFRNSMIKINCQNDEDVFDERRVKTGRSSCGRRGRTWTRVKKTPRHGVVPACAVWRSTITISVDRSVSPANGRGAARAFTSGRSVCPERADGRTDRSHAHARPRSYCLPRLICAPLSLPRPLGAGNRRRRHRRCCRVPPWDLGELCILYCGDAVYTRVWLRRIWYIPYGPKVSCA